MATEPKFTAELVLQPHEPLRWGRVVVSFAGHLVLEVPVGGLPPRYQGVDVEGADLDEEQRPEVVASSLRVFFEDVVRLNSKWEQLGL